MKLQNDIYEYFGYEEDWCVFPIEDRREYFWRINGDERDGTVEYCSEPTFTDEDHLYSDEIFTQRFLSKWVYRGKDYTMILVDTHTDGNKFLAIYENAKQKET